MKNWLSTNYIIVFILFVSSVLRFYNLFEIPFTHDEFSTLFRTNFSSFDDLIEKGVKIDTHPAGLQVFVYYFKQLFGEQEWVIKIPFLIFGIFSVWLTYIIFFKWYNQTIALICSSYVASLQYTIMYSQIARPYASGLFFILALVYFWNRICFEKRHTLFNYVMYVFIASLCLYNHHFSALLAFVISLSGLFFLNKTERWKFILCGLTIVILYVPHISVFLAQLQIGGLSDWLNKPTSIFIIYYLFYTFQFSFVVILILLLLIVYSFVDFNRLKYFSRENLICLIWFVIPFLTGYLYSVLRSPVLQYSVLIFSFPFLLPLFLGGIKQQRTNVNLLIVVVIISVNVCVLVFQRQHYTVFYQSIYKNIIKDYNQFNSKGTISIIDTEFLHRTIENHYVKKWGVDSNFVWMDTFVDFKSFQHFLKQSATKYNQLYLGAVFDSHPLIVPLIQEYYPKIIVEHNFVSGSTYLFTKGNSSKNLASIMDFKRNRKGWTKLETLSKYVHNELCEMDSTIEYSPSFEISLNQLINDDDNYIDISVKVKPFSNTIKSTLVSTLDTPTKNIDWRGTDFSTFIDSTSIDTEWVTIYHSIKLSDINIKENNIKLKILVWNPHKDHFYMDDFKIKIRKGNPKIYGFFNKLN